MIHATYSLAAAMLRSDGGVDPLERQTAETIGLELFEDFDPTEFREHCDNPRERLSAVQLSEAIRARLPEENRKRIFKYLCAVALANGEIATDETALLGRIADGVRLFSQAQYRERWKWNATNGGFNQVPEPFDAAQAIESGRGAVVWWPERTTGERTGWNQRQAARECGWTGGHRSPGRK